MSKLGYSPKERLAYFKEHLSTRSMDDLVSLLHDADHLLDEVLLERGLYRDEGEVQGTARQLVQNEIDIRIPPMTP